jgi:hypothetical protein
MMVYIRLVFVEFSAKLLITRLNPQNQLLYLDQLTLNIGYFGVDLHG